MCGFQRSRKRQHGPSRVRDQVVADMDGNVDTNAGNVNVPEEAANKPATTIAGVEQTLDVTTEEAPDTGAEAAETTRLAAEEEGEEVHVEGITPADKLL